MRNRASTPAAALASSKEEATWPHVAAFCTKSQRLAMLPGGTKLATHGLTATAISAARVAPIISHRRGRGETQPKKTLTIASQAKGTAFSVKPSGIFRKSSHHFLPPTIWSTSIAYARLRALQPASPIGCLDFFLRRSLIAYNAIAYKVKLSVC